MDILLTLITKHKNKTLVLAGVLLAAVLFVIYGLVQGNTNFSFNNSVRSYDYATEEAYFEEPQALGLAASKSLRASTDDIGYPVYPTVPQSESQYDESIDRQVIKNGSLSLVVKDIDATRSSIAATVKQLGGFISNANFNEHGVQPYDNVYREVREHIIRSGYLTIRVPSDKFDQAINTFKGYALTVQNESVNSNDVTEQYADLEAQIKNKEAVEKQYQALLTRATKIEDILKITQYLNQTRGEVERMQGSLNRLSNQVTLSTISVNLTAEEDIELFGVVWSPLQELKAGFQNLLQDLVGFINHIIRFVFALPVIILYILLYGAITVVGLTILAKVGRKIWPKLRKK